MDASALHPPTADHSHWHPDRGPNASDVGGTQRTAEASHVLRKSCEAAAPAVAGMAAPVSQTKSRFRMAIAWLSRAIWSFGSNFSNGESIWN